MMKPDYNGKHWKRMVVSAWVEGFVYARRGGPRRDNPYLYGDTEKAWALGFDAWAADNSADFPAIAAAMGAE